MEFNEEYLYNAYILLNDGKVGMIRKTFPSRGFYGVYVKGEDELREIHASELRILDEFLLSQKGD